MTQTLTMSKSTNHGEHFIGASWEGIRHHSYFVHVLYLILYFLEKTLSPINLKFFYLINDWATFSELLMRCMSPSLRPRHCNSDSIEGFNGTRMVMWQALREKMQFGYWECLLSVEGRLRPISGRCGSHSLLPFLPPFLCTHCTTMPPY